jgi:hypothetical protein
MPRTTFSTDNVRQSATGFPKLRLEHGEVARVVCIEDGPVFEWVHSVNKPKISPVSGQVMMETHKKRDGTEYQDYAMEFLGTPVCLGDPDVLEEKGVDVAHCPLCKLSAEDEAFRGPVRRFAIHVLKYKTKQGKPEIAEPFSVETLVWVMSDKRFSELAQIFAEWSPEGEAPDPRKIDLILGPCINAGFQNYKINPGQRCEMLADRDRLTRALETYKNNHAPDLSAYCGRVTEKKWILQMIEEVQERYAEIRAGGRQTVPVDTSDTLDLDSSLLDTEVTRPASRPANSTSVATPPVADAPPGEGDPLNEFKVGGSAQELLPEPTAEEAPISTTVSGAGPEVDFDALMSELEGVK